MENKRVINAIRLMIAIVILTVVVFVVDLIINRDKKITDLIVNINKKKIADNYNGIYTYKEDLGRTVYAFSNCSFTSINNYILIVNNDYYLFRSSCMGTYLKEQGETKSLNIGEYSNTYFVTHEGLRYNKDTTVKSIIPNNGIAEGTGALDLNALSIIAKETEFEGNYYDMEKRIKGLNVDIKVFFNRNADGSFNLIFKNRENELYRYIISSFDNMPTFYPLGSRIAIIEPGDNSSDSTKYSYKFKVLGLNGIEYDLNSYFPQKVNGVDVSYDNSVYIAYDQKERTFRVFFGNNKKFCVENSTSENIAYYEYKVSFDYGNNKFKKPDFVGVTREKDGCSDIKNYLSGGVKE